MNISRRICVLFSVLCAPLLLLSSTTKKPKAAAKTQYLAYVGTYTTKTDSKGIYAYRYDATTGNFSSLGVAAESADPSFVAAHPNGKFLYAVNEAGKNSMVSAFALERKDRQADAIEPTPGARRRSLLHLLRQNRQVRSGGELFVRKHSCVSDPAGRAIGRAYRPGATQRHPRAEQGAPGWAARSLDRDFAGQPFRARR